MATPKPKARFVDFEEMLSIEPQQDTAPAPVQGGILEMDFSLMESFPNHRFKLYEGQQLVDMVESIRQFGILLPIILWHTEDGQYIILSGHNRKNAAQLAGLTKGPVIIRENLTYEDAVLIVTETNLRQRSFSDMSHSERAYCLAQHYEALKSQGKRNDLLEEIEMILNPHGSEENSTSSEVQTKSRSDTKLGQDYGLSRDKVAKYIRISNLIDPLILRVDTGEIAFLAAYDLSFVEDTAKQQQIADLMESVSYKVDMKKAELFHSYYETGKLTDTAIVQILSGEKTRKPKSSKPQPVKIKPAVISKYFTPQQTQKEIEETIDKALALYFENQNKEVAS
ncbi:ParB N-terminal domain-containing protein [Anaerocolumna sp. AGMB13025]|uniref:ParB N-terminal domain-containing protein n=1 Tax=Anaerocolumna sp. AGMB13025 TaxID=3039116 RepID=UPI00241C2246|nr:ParB N-terminal domain-containing protein [Anaerocolumna sp. AGMB13025]WFR59137.1 ParB N-terminal domain-containing protein [Anaerocolumna sp. AGMB13025]